MFRIFAAIPILGLFALLAWIANIYKLSQCDFDAPYRCEIIHIIGLAGPAAMVTVWMGTDAKPPQYEKPL